MQIAKTIFGAFGFGAVALLFWRPAGNLAVCSDSNDTPPPVSYKIEFGEKSFWAVHSHITRLEPADNEFAAREQTFRVAKNIGINFVRTGFIWRDIQPEPNRWQWTKFDSVVLSARRQRVHLLGLVHTPPQWAFPAHEHLNEWTVFLDSVVTRYGDYITDWEIWNEPNIDKFWPTRAPIEGYFELVKRSHQLIKQRKPRATVLLGGMANQPSAFVMWEKLMGLGVGFLRWPRLSSLWCCGRGACFHPSAHSRHRRGAQFLPQTSLDHRIRLEFLATSAASGAFQLICASAAVLFSTGIKNQSSRQYFGFRRYVFSGDGNL